MRFTLTEEQAGFARSLDDLLGAADLPAVIRAWAAHDTGPGLKLWASLAELGVNGLVVPESAGGLGASYVDLVVAFEALGRHAVPGPWVESVAYLPTAVTDPALLGALAEGAVATVSVAPHTPRALDADVAEHVFAVVDGEVRMGSVGALHRSMDPARRLFDVEDNQIFDVPDDAEAAFDVAVLACSAQLLGLGEHLLAITVDYVKQRRQFGRTIGEYQALKHQLADVRVALDFARPLVHGAALTMAPRDVSAAKLKAGEAAYLAARTALQLHGAIGYTAEYDLGLWLTKVRALRGAWGTAAEHRARILATLVAR